MQVVIQESVIDAKINVFIRYCEHRGGLKSTRRKLKKKLPGKFMGVELVMEQ